MDKFSVTRTTRHSYGSRISESLKQVGGGALMVLIAIPLLFWNEGRAVQTAKSLAEGAAVVVSIAADTLDNGHEGALVHLTGEATTESTLRDPTFGIAAESAIRLRRVVEMYQWSESEKTETQRDTGGSETRVTTYEYRGAWSDRHVDSTRFHESHRFSNPPAMPYESLEEVADTVTVGPFVLGERLVSQIHRTEHRPFTEHDLASLPDEVRQQAEARNLTIRDGVLYAANDPRSPAIGDFRVRFEVIHPLPVSVIARQSGAHLIPYQTAAGDALALLQVGVHDADAMFAAAMSANSQMTWALRAIGLVLLFFGFNLVLRPLAVVADVLPLLGDVLRLGTGFVAAVLAGSVALITIASGWLAYRPVIGGLLLGTAVVLIAGIKYLAVKKRKATARVEPPAAAGQSPL